MNDAQAVRPAAPPLNRLTSLEEVAKTLKDATASGHFYYLTETEPIQWVGIKGDGIAYPISHGFNEKHEMLTWFETGRLPQEPASIPIGLWAEALRELEQVPEFPGDVVQQEGSGEISYAARQYAAINTPEREEPDGYIEPIINEPSFTDRGGTLEDIVNWLRKTEADFMDATRRRDTIQADYKAKLQEFNNSNAELIELKDTAQKQLDALEIELKRALVSWGKISGVKKFDEYLSVIESEEFEIDEAAATEWARTNYPAAINEVTNQKLIAEYVKTTKQPLPFVTFRKEIKPKISRRFE